VPLVSGFVPLASALALPSGDPLLIFGFVL
jgi:hypothetical protein